MFIGFINLVIVAGHARVMACKDIGHQSVPFNNVEFGKMAVIEPMFGLV